MVAILTMVWDRTSLRSAIEQYFRSQEWEFPIQTVSLNNVVADLEEAVAWFYPLRGFSVTKDFVDNLKQALDSTTGKEWEVQRFSQSVIVFKRSSGVELPVF